MACNAAVISSNTSSLPEVGGDAALYFDPHNTDDITEKISQVLNNQTLKKELIEKGNKRYQKFSWEKLAQQTLEIYQKCLN